LKNKVFYRSGCEKRDEIRLFGRTEKRFGASSGILAGRTSGRAGNSVGGYNLQRADGHERIQEDP
jgi:hypothetical protein